MVSAVTGSAGSFGQIAARFQAYGIPESFVKEVAGELSGAGALLPQFQQQFFDLYQQGNEQVSLDKQVGKVAQAGSYENPQAAYNQGVASETEGYHRPVILGPDGRPARDYLAEKQAGQKKFEDLPPAEQERVVAAKGAVINNPELQAKAGKVLGGEVINDGGELPGLMVKQGAVNPASQIIPGNNDPLARSIMGAMARLGAIGVVSRDGVNPMSAAELQQLGATSGAATSAGATVRGKGGGLKLGGALGEADDQTLGAVSGAVSSGGGAGGGGGLPPGLTIGGPMPGFGNVTSLITSGSGAAMMGLGSMTTGMMGSFLSIGFPGLEHQLRSQMRSMAYEMRSQYLIDMINNPSIPIEKLIGRFVAETSQNQQDKIRDQMEEMVVQGQIENREKAAKGALGTIGGALGVAFGGAAGAEIGTTLGEKAAETVMATQRIGAGRAKSQAVMQMELQMLINDWKQMFEMSSNMSKALHDMGMTAIRNIRG